MTSKEGNDPILSVNSKNIKNDILLFKNETLKDIKDAQKKMSEKYQILDFEIKEKLELYEQRITTYENKIIELSTLINTDKMIRDKVEKLIEFKEKAEDTMLTEKIRLDNFRNDLNRNVERIDKILTDSVIYPGIIGGISKYKTFHDLIDYVLTQCSQNLTFREKSILDFKGYKIKLENTIESFNTQVNSILNSTSEYTKTCVKELEERIKSIFNIYDDRLQDTRIENANYAIGLEKATELLKKELENLYIIKKELYEKVDNGINEVKNDNTRVVKLFTGYKKNFHIIQHKFTQLSDFIKDIRFRINLKEDVKRREYSHMSDLINFDKKDRKGFYDGVYDINKIKKGFASQIKDYIEGKISADQLFKKRSDINKSTGKKSSDNINYDINNINEINQRKYGADLGRNKKNTGEEVKLNIVDLLKNSLSKKISSEKENGQISNLKKEIIKEEDDENNNSSKELNSIFYKTTKEKNINTNLLEKEQDKLKEENIIDKNKRDNSTTKPKKEESKIQIISKDISDEKEKIKEKIENNDNNDKNHKPNLQNVISDLFSAKDKINNIINQNNEKSLNDKKVTQNEKNQNNDLKKSDNNISNKLIIDTKPDLVKTQQINKTFNRPGTVINIKRNNNNNNNNNIGIITNNELLNNQKNNKNSKNNRLLSGKENVKTGNQEVKNVTVTLYNSTVTSLGDYIQTLNYKVNNSRKKANSTNQNNKNYFLKQSTNSSTKKSQFGSKKDDTITIQNMVNNLTNYIPKDDINVDTKFLSSQKKNK